MSDALIRLEKRIHRPIRKSDITIENVGFSNIVVHRIFGSLDEARRQCGLLYHTPSEKEKDVSHYVDILDSVVLDFINTTGREQITWRDIESGLYGAKTYTHKTFLKMFSKNNIDIRKHLKSVGVTLCGDSSFSYKYIFDDGELVRSGMEYDMTQFIKNEMGLKYGYDYIRDVKYNRFADTTSKIDCDYVIISSHHPLFIEVAGMLDNTDSNDWIIKDYASDIKRDYRDTLAYKAYILNDINAKYLFLFSNDMLDGSYKNKVRHFIEMNCA